MGEHWLAGDPPIAIAVRQSPRARRMTLRISRADGTVTLTMPQGMPVREGLAFASDREEWLRRHLQDIRANLFRHPGLTFGASIPFRGVPVTLVAAGVRRPVIKGQTLLLPAGEDRIGARLQAFLKATARDVLVAATDRHARSQGLSWGRVTLRDTRGRWGSCSARGDLMYSWRLVMAPEDVLDYVVVHEVAHLAQMNHSPAFWKVVAQMMPDYERSREWLRRNGSTLHAIRFTD